MKISILSLCLLLLSIKQIAYSQSSEIASLKEKLRVILENPFAAKKQYPSIDGGVRFHYRYGLLWNNTTSAKKYLKQLTKELEAEFVGGAVSLNLVNPNDNYANEQVVKAASQTITATNLITGTAKVSYKAGNSITLNPGFRAENGTIFSVQVNGCN